MGQAPGLGVSHYPPLSGSDADMANLQRARLADPDIPAPAKGPATWPPAMQREWVDPASPSPRRCFDMGAAAARVLRDSPWRVAVLAASSWSHAFLVDKTYRLQPDIEADRALYATLVAGELAAWRDYPLAQLEDAGQQEMLNWFALAGAMHALGARLAWSDFVETHVLNSSKVAAVFGPARYRFALDRINLMDG